MGSQYNRLGREYAKVEGLPLRRYVELFSFFDVLGDIKGKAVLDAGCGTGIYTRLLKQRGAARMVGLDRSADMIEAARDAERARPAGIEYIVGDLAGAGALGPFDIVTAGYVLHHAATAEEMLASCRGIHGALSPGGRFVSVMMSYAFQTADPDYYRPYGLTVMHDGSRRDGSSLTVAITSGPIELTLRTCYWTKQGYESALAEAGLSGFRWHNPQVDPAGVAEHGKTFWRAYLEHPHMLVFECVRGRDE